MLELEIIDAAGNRSQHCLAVGTYRLGKAQECEIPLLDDYASRYHAELVVGEGVSKLVDTGSTNGLWRGSERIDAIDSLVAGDSIRLGKSTISILVQGVAGENQAIVAPTVLPAKKPRAANISDADEPAEISEFKRDVHEKVLESLDLHKRSLIHTYSPEELRLEATNTCKQVIRDNKLVIPRGYEQEQLIEEIVAEAIGLGPIEPLLDDESITEVMVNGPDQIYIERAGKLERSSKRFNSEASLLSIIERIVTPLGRRIDESSPMVDARLRDGSRVNAIIPPLSLIGPVLTIRKFSKRKLSIDDLIEKGTLSSQMGEFLKIAVENHRNIIVSGGTGSGKTTTLNVLSNFIPQHERILTIEDAAELQLNQDHLISLESRPSNVEGKGQVAIRDLVKNALRMRPDRIVVGECRGGEALDMLQAMNTGHDGSMTTGHANTPRDLLSRLEVMVLMSGMDLPVRAIREQIASAVDIILQQTRFSDGRRRITSIVEIDGMEGDTILMQQIFKFVQTGRDADGMIAGEFGGLGYAPSFYTELEASGVQLKRDIFGTPEGMNSDTGEWAQTNG